MPSIAKPFEPHSLSLSEEDQHFSHALLSREKPEEIQNIATDSGFKVLWQKHSLPDLARLKRATKDSLVNWGDARNKNFSKYLTTIPFIYFLNVWRTENKNYNTSSFLSLEETKKEQRTWMWNAWLFAHEWAAADGEEVSIGGNMAVQQFRKRVANKQRHKHHGGPRK